MTASAEQFAPAGDDVQICFQTFGEPSAEPLLLVMGLGGPMTWWDPELCEMLADAGFFVIRYDNRDTGRSTKIKGRVRKVDLVRGFLGRKVAAPYTLEDMARDGFAVLDHLGIDSAHVCGMSMGGMIVQTMALLDRKRVRSLVSIMSTTGRRWVGFQHPTLFPSLLWPRGAGREGYVENSAAFWQLIQSPAYPRTKEDVQRRAAETWDRGFSASGVARQMLAVVSQPDRTRALQKLDLPAAVIHGKADKMVHPSGGKATARAIPGCDLVLIPGMGHDTPHELFEDFTTVIRRTADRARSRTS